MVHNQTGRMPSSEDVHMWNDLPNRDWENRKGCFFGSLKLLLKILAASLQPYVLFMFFVKTFFITWLYIQVISYIQPSVKLPALLTNPHGQRIPFTKGFFYPLLIFFLIFIFHNLVKKLPDIKSHQKTEQPPAKGKCRLKMYTSEEKGSCTFKLR